jgi:hypothetical protein
VNQMLRDPGADAGRADLDVAPAIIDVRDRDADAVSAVRPEIVTTPPPTSTSIIIPSKP